MNKELFGNVKRIVLLGLILFFVSTASAELPRYPVQPVDSLPKIDGSSDDICWKTLPMMGEFVDKLGLPAKIQTETQIGYDPNNLYILVRLFEPEMDKVFAKKTDHDSGIWNDDDIEIFLTTSDKLAPFYIFRVNSIGTTEEGHMEDPVNLWNIEWSSVVVREKDAWVVEMAIPWSSLKISVPMDGSILRVNICRFRAHASGTTAWSNAMDYFPATSRFGELIFLKNRPLNSVTIKGEPQPSGGKVSITATGESAFYNNRVIWMYDGERAKDGYSGFTLKGSTAVTDTLLFKEDGQECKAQVEIYESKKDGKLVYRSEWVTAKYTDPITARMTKIDTMFSELENIKTPSSLKSMKATWPIRKDELKNSKDEMKSRQLLQEFRAAKWITSLSVKNQKKDALWFPQMTFADTDYDYLPKPDEIGASVKIEAMADEYETGCVNVIPLRSDGNYRIRMEDLAGPKRSIIPASSFDIRILKNWYQSGKGGFAETSGVGIWTAELLVKDDSILEVDHIRRRNKMIHYNDGPDLKPVMIPRFSTRQFWLTVHVPKDQQAGLYKGVAHVECNGKPVMKIPVEVNVLPFVMPKSNFTWSMYYYRRYDAGKEPAPGCYDRYEQDLRMAPQYGLTSMSIKEGVPAKMDGELVVSYDFSLVRKGLDLRKKYNLMGKTFFFGGPWDTAPIDKLYNQKTEDLLTKPYFKANWILLCKGLVELKKEYGLEEIYMYGLDEPGYDASGERMRMERILCEWSKEAGIKCASAITLAGAIEVKDVLELPILDTPNGEIGEHRRKFPFSETWLYWHPLENPTVDRMMTGIILWYGGYQGVAPWIYQMAVEQGWAPKLELGWDDWIDTMYGYRQQSYVYSGQSVPVPTIEYAAFREGADDVKYLELLESKVNALEAKSLDDQGKAVLAEAKAWLDAPPKKYRGTYYSLQNELKAADFAEFRAQTVQLLLNVENLLELEN